MKNKVPGELRIVWWNTYDFFHFRPDKVKKGEESRWPSSRLEYEAKCQKVDDAFLELFKLVGMPDIICLCEITKIAATQLRDRVFPGYLVRSLDVIDAEPTLQVAILHAPDNPHMRFEEQLPIVVERTARHSRPMAVLDVILGAHTVRIVACHWQARNDEEGSEDQRFRNADTLSAYTYDFIIKNKEFNHLVIVGDLNEEPYERSLRNLNAHRHRGRALGKAHWADEDVKRLHLYNTSWRLLGEKYGHPLDSTKALMEHSAGTYFRAAKKTWHNFDQLIVSGGLLQDELPHLNENESTVISTPAFLTNGLPEQFAKKGTGYRGLSDHLPLFAKICF